MTISVSDFGAAADDLEGLRVELQAANPLIRLGNRTRSGARIGEYRFEIGPGRSVYVQAPVTPAGQRRTWYSPRTRWRYGRRTAGGWHYAATCAQVATAILKNMRRYWDGAHPGMRGPPLSLDRGVAAEAGRGCGGSGASTRGLPPPQSEFGVLE